MMETPGLMNYELINIQKGKTVAAEYLEQPLPEYRGNPLIEALPPIFSTEDLFDRIASLPPYCKEERDLPDYIREHCLLRLLKYFEPLTMHKNVERQISGMLRNGYINRNPLSKEYLNNLDMFSEMINRKSTANSINNLTLLGDDYESMPSGFSFIGLSGMGKTSTIKRILSMYPQVILHTNYKGTRFTRPQIVWLKLDCPVDGSLKSLCKCFFKAVDDALGTTCYKKFGSKTLSDMVIIMPYIAYIYNIGAIFFDELQYLSKSKSGAEIVLGFLVSLVNNVGVPVVNIGTFKAFPILQRDFAEARRASGIGEIIWDRMPNNKEWQWFLKQMWNYQWTKKENPLTDEIAEAMYKESQGIIDRTIKLYILAQRHAIWNKTETLTKDLIIKVSNEHMRMTRPMIKAITSNDPKQLAIYDDIRPPDVEQLFEHTIQDARLDMEIEQIRNVRKKELQKAETETLKGIMVWLMEAGIDPQTAEKAAHMVLDRFGNNQEASFLKKGAMEIISNIVKNTGEAYQ